MISTQKLKQQLYNKSKIGKPLRLKHPKHPWTHHLHQSFCHYTVEKSIELKTRLMENIKLTSVHLSFLL